MFQLMMDRPKVQIALKRFEGLLHLRQLHVPLPEDRRLLSMSRGKSSHGSQARRM